MIKITFLAFDKEVKKIKFLKKAIDKAIQEFINSEEIKDG